MGLRRGFKAEADERAADLRRELGLGRFDRLDPLQVAEYLDIPVVPLSSYVAGTPGAVHLLKIEPDAFSAATVFHGTRRTIVHNDFHSPGRVCSNLCHELSHGLLLHSPTLALDGRGNRLWNQDVEDEASWLGGVLLVPADAALRIARGWLTVEDAADHFGVSVEMINWRLNMTGARKRVARARRTWQAA